MAALAVKTDKSKATRDAEIVSSNSDLAALARLAGVPRGHDSRHPNGPRAGVPATRDVTPGTLLVSLPG